VSSTPTHLPQGGSVLFSGERPSSGQHGRKQGMVWNDSSGMIAAESCCARGRALTA